MSRRSARSIAIGAALAAMLAAACGASRETPAKAPETSSNTALPRFTPPPPPTLRLPEAARPLRYDLDLTLDPSKDDFTGVIGIDLAVKEATRIVWLNAKGLKIREAHAMVGGQKWTARVVGKGDDGDDFVGFAFDRPIAPGSARLVVAYDGSIDKERPLGLYRASEGPGPDDWYIYSVFEPIDARRAFPCFDEPNYKVPWKLSLRVKKEHVALANAKVESETALPNGMKTVVFEESKPIPSYLVALVVGPFDIVDAGTAGRHGTPLRFVVPRGRGAETRYAAEVTPKLVGILEDYFGIPYPYGKLDVAVVPRFQGTMEHPGLVALGQPLTLIKPGGETIARKQRYANIAGHELGHYWFGDYVTMQWWDDTWLNEAFTSWIDAKVTSALEPSWKLEQGRVRGRSNAMGTDSLASAQKVRIPITSNDDIENSLNTDITYIKGSAVIGMFERYVGPEKFQKAVSRYMKTHAWKNATADDFLAALRAETNDDDLSPAWKTFVDQPGVPLVTTELVCAKDSAPKVLLSQERFVPVGSKLAQNQSWQIPVCVKYGSGKGTARACTLLKTQRGTMDLDPAKGCPEWVLSNENGAGYYRSRYDATALSKLVKKAWPSLDATERMALISDTAALVHNGTIGIDDALGLLPEMLKGADRNTIEASFEIVHQVRKDNLPAELVPSYTKYVRKLYGETAKSLGWKSKPGEDADARQLRLSLLRVVGNTGEDPVLRQEARELVRKWLSDRKAVEPEVLETALVLAAKTKDRDLWGRLRNVLRETRDRNEQSQVLLAMGSFRDPALVQQTFDLFLTDEIRVSDARPVFQAALFERDSREQAYEFIKKNFERLSKDASHRDMTVVQAASAHCDKEHHEENIRFFTERVKKIEGGPRILSNALEKQALCIALRERNDKRVADFLKARP